MKENSIEQYITTVIEKFKTGHAGEHGYRGAFETLIKTLLPNIQPVNDPKRSEHGAPDFIFMRSNELTAGYAETKDVNIDLDDTEKGEQMRRYLGYDTLILTNYLEFRFFRHGEKYGESITIAKIHGNEIVVDESKFQALADVLKDFLTEIEPIKSSTKLAKIMGGKARRLRDNVKVFVADQNQKNDELRKIFESFKKILIHDLTETQFADMYAQTLVYGLFAARYEDDSVGMDFTRQKARDLVPASNPFLRHFFDHIVGANFDHRLAIIVNELCEVFTHADVHRLMHEYATQKGLLGSDKSSADPVIHFYEDFLKEYDSEQRKKLGAFYTPLPVVKFIIRAVDHILEKDFGLAHGLADTTKIDWKRTKQGKTATTQIHKVQILDPATGTGTFLNEVVKNILARFTGQEGRWKSYVDTDLLPRLHGFELMMAPYTIAHLKIAMTLHDSGYTDFHNRLGIYLTNSLEEGAVADNTLFGFGFGQAITEESQAAAEIKNDTPIMVVIGNPPYSGVSSNETDYANNLVNKYKVEPGGKIKLQERKHWLNDDYVKFIAFAEDMIEKNGEGIVGFVTNHGYLDNPTFRGMRWHLMQTFDSIYILDLHGNSKKKEAAPDGGKDENVFDIQQGVAIMIGVKTGKKKNAELAKVFRADVWGKRQDKFEKLSNLSFKNTKWVDIEARLPNLFFSQGGLIEVEDEYKKGFGINELFSENVSGIVTARDGLVISKNKKVLLERIKNFTDENVSDSEIRKNFFPNKKNGKYIAGDSRGWKLAESRKVIANLNHEDEIEEIDYRPFDTRFIYYHPKMVDWGREKIMKHMLCGNNISLIASKINRQQSLGYFFVSKFISDFHILDTAGDSTFQFPLYLSSEDGSKIPNLKKEIVDEIEKIVGKISPEDIFDYIYAVLYSPSYREEYKEFLKIDFPRVPYPKDKESFDRLVMIGRELRKLHLLESSVLNKPITTFPVAGTDIVESKYPKFEKVKDVQVGKVYINETQFFGNVPEVAWNFYIGGYQPAQKWLKDRRGRTLSSEDLQHYQKMIVALFETDRIMKEIDLI